MCECEWLFVAIDSSRRPATKSSGRRKWMDGLMVQIHFRATDVDDWLGWAAAILAPSLRLSCSCHGNHQTSPITSVHQRNYQQSRQSRLRPFQTVVLISPGTPWLTSEAPQCSASRTCRWFISDDGHVSLRGAAHVSQEVRPKKKNQSENCLFVKINRPRIMCFKLYLVETYMDINCTHHNK